MYSAYPSFGQVVSPGQQYPAAPKIDYGTWELVGGDPAMLPFYNLPPAMAQSNINRGGPQSFQRGREHFWVRMLIPSQNVGAIIGRQGSIVREIVRESGGATIFVKDEKLTLTDPSVTLLPPQRSKNSPVTSHNIDCNIVDVHGHPKACHTAIRGILRAWYEPCQQHKLSSPIGNDATLTEADAATIEVASTENSNPSASNSKDSVTSGASVPFHEAEAKPPSEPSTSSESVNLSSGQGQDASTKPATPNISATTEEDGSRAENRGDSSKITATQDSNTSATPATKSADSHSAAEDSQGDTKSKESASASEAQTQPEAEAKVASDAAAEGEGEDESESEKKEEGGNTGADEETGTGGSKPRLSSGATGYKSSKKKDRTKGEREFVAWLLAEERFCGRIIGLHGKNVDTILKNTGCSIVVSNRQLITMAGDAISLDRTVTVRGPTIDNVADAVDRVTSIQRSALTDEMRALAMNAKKFA